MEFCEKCGGMMVPISDEDGSRNLKCRSCGYSFEKSYHQECYNCRTEMNSGGQDLSWICPACSTTYPRCPECAGIINAPECGYIRGPFSPRIMVVWLNKPKYVTLKCTNCEWKNRITISDRPRGLGEEIIEEPYKSKIRINCPECECNEAYYYNQKKYDGYIEIYKCCRCGHSWRKHF